MPTKDGYLTKYDEHEKLIKIIGLTKHKTDRLGKLFIIEVSRESSIAEVNRDVRGRYQSGVASETIKAR